MKKIILFISALFICTFAIAHTINWHVGNQIIETTTCDSGESITPPTAPTKYGYTFREWVGYEFLEYIEGETNRQYINTDIIPNSNMNIYCKGMFVSATQNNSAVFFSVRDTANAGTGVQAFYSPTVIAFDWFGADYLDRYTVSVTRTNGDIVEYNIVNSLVTIKHNGSLLGTQQLMPSGTVSYELFINALNNGGTIGTGVGVISRIYRFTIEGIADMRPARRPSDGAVGMYDMIRKQFFTNAGTGQFIAGPVINE